MNPSNRTSFAGRRPALCALALPAALAIAVVLAAVSLCGSASAAPQALGPQQPAAPSWGPDRIGGYATTHVILKLKPGVAPARLADGQSTLRVNAGANPALSKSARPLEKPLDTVMRIWRVNAITPALRHQPANKALAASLGLDRYYRVAVPAGSNTPRLAADLARFNSIIDAAQVDGIGSLASVIPDDPEFDLLYGLLNTGQTIQFQPGTPGADIDATNAWDISTGSPNVTLAVIDSGVDPHVELGDRLLTGWYVIDDSTDTADICDHGTHVAGTAAATGDNGIGIAGVAWSVKVLPVRVLQMCTVSSSVGEANTAEGLMWAVDHGADVANMSLQFFAGTPVLHDAVLYAQASGVVMVAATGNQGTSSVAFPARWPETIAVAATDNNDARWFFSNFGPEVDVAAPGVNIYSLLDTSGYRFNTGTSFAVAHVSGVACLVRSVNPWMTAAQVRSAIEDTAEDVGESGFDIFTGRGRINAAAAVARAQALLPDLNHDGHVNGLDLALLLGQWTGAAAYAPCPPHAQADLNVDCRINGLDLAMLLAAWTG